MQFIDCEQRSPEWYAARCGKPTASDFATVLAKGKGGAPSVTRAKYMAQLAGERITGVPEEGYVNGDMRRGIEMEPEALRFYAFLEPRKIVKVGFIDCGRWGASPDALVADEGLLEIKTAKPSILLPLRQRGAFPSEHRAQVQGQLWCTGRDWCDLLVYWPGVPEFLIRTHRDEVFIAELASEVERFCDELDALVHHLITGEPLPEPRPREETMTPPASAKVKRPRKTKAAEPAASVEAQPAPTSPSPSPQPVSGAAIAGDRRGPNIAGHGLNDADPSHAPMIRAMRRGYADAAAGMSRNNPPTEYLKRPDLVQAWDCGWGDHLAERTIAVAKPPESDEVLDGIAAKAFA